jgi:hypothetical protein
MDERQRRIARARLLRRQGKTYDEIRAALNITAGDDTLLRWLRGIPRPDATRRSHPKHDERRRARQMRMTGATYPEIAAELSVAMGSLSLWLRDLPVPERVRHRRVAHLEGLRGIGGHKLHRRALARRDRRLTLARSAVGAISDRELFFMGLALYWAEGSKDKPWKRHGRVRLTNSDAGLLQIYLSWLQLLGVRRDELTFSLSIHENSDVPANERWWQQQLGLDTDQFRHPMLKRHNPKPRRHNTGDSYHGCLVVTVKCSTALYDAIDGWWRGALDGVNGKAGDSDRVALVRVDPGSSKGRTASFGVAYGGSNPSPGAVVQDSSPWLAPRWWNDVAPVPSEKAESSVRLPQEPV